MSSSEKCLVVLVEDDESIRAAFSDILSAEGYDVLAYASGREALDSLDREPSLILLDWMMPGMSGEEFLHARAREPRVQESPVVVVSAMSSYLSKVPGISALIPKPIDVDELLGVVKNHCRRAPLSALG